MKGYRDVEKIIDNETVLHILNQAKLLDEKKLLAKTIEKSKDREVYEIYATFKEDLNYVALIEKKIGEVNSWYLRFRVNLRFRS